ncbi:tetratricopeptide repeat-containing sensor histidine kinase [Ferruginibacter profundus]
MLKFICCLLIVLYSQPAFCQTPPLPKLDQFKTQKEKLDTLKGYCKAILYTRDFDALLNATAKGIALSENNFSYRAYFNYFRGYAFQELKQYDSAAANTLLAVNFYEKDGNLKGEADAMRRLHYIYYYAGRGEERVPMMKKAVDIVDTTKNEKAKSVLVAMLGEYYFDQGLYEKAIEFKLKYIEVEKNKTLPLDDQTMNDIAVSNSQVAETYILIRQPAKAVQYLNESKLWYRDYYRGEALCYSNLVTAFIDLNQPDSALENYKKLYRVMKPNDSLPEILTSANGSLANYYIAQNNMQQALFFADKEFAVSQKSNEPIAVMGSHVTLGNVFCKMGQFEKAIMHLNIAEDNSYAFGRESVATIRLLQAKSYAGLGNWQKAYLKYDAYTILHDSIVAESSTKNIADAEAKFQNKEKQQQIENKNLQLKVERNRILWLITGVTLLFLIAILLLAINRNKKKTSTILQKKNDTLARLNSELEEANQTKAKLFGIISHDLRNPINQVYQFLKLQQLNPTSLSDQQKNELSTKIQTATGSLLETMEDLLLWSKTQMSEFKVNIQAVPLLPVIDSCKNLLQLNSDAKNIHFKNLITDDVIVNTDPYYLQTIVRNLLQNAVKASPENSEIEIGTKALANGVSLYIKNQGTTFSQEQYENILNSEEAVLNLNGLGLRLVDELAKKINATILFKSATIGTFAEIQLVDN